MCKIATFREACPYADLLSKSDSFAPFAGCIFLFHIAVGLKLLNASVGLCALLLSTYQDDHSWKSTSCRDPTRQSRRADDVVGALQDDCSHGEHLRG